MKYNLAKIAVITLTLGALALGLPTTGRAQSSSRGGLASVTEAAVLGRVGVDLYPDALRTPLRDVRHYTRYVGDLIRQLP